MKLYAITLKSNFGFFKKPDINDKIFITYNMIHKPAILGILGAIAGFGGYAQNDDKKTFPEFYEKLKDLRVAIKPIESEDCIFKKEFIKYNNTVTSSQTSNITEQTLINPAYRIYFSLDENNKELQEKLIKRLKNGEAEYIPYMGKNDFSLFFKDFSEDLNLKEFQNSKNTQISTLVLKPNEEFKLIGRGYRENSLNYFYYHERLPIKFDKNLKQYEYRDFFYSNVIFKDLSNLDNLYETSEGVICLF